MKNQKTRKILTCSTVFASLLAVAILALNFTFVEANSQSDCDHDCHQALETARNATVQYQYIEHAIADDFVQVSPLRPSSRTRRDGFSLRQFCSRRKSEFRPGRTGNIALPARQSTLNF